MTSTTTNKLGADITDNVRIVGIGASAGGLLALEQFLKNTPVDSQLAYIVVQHLDPEHKGMLPELLQRATPMPVNQAHQHMQIQANHVYVIPPNTELTVVNQHLHLQRPTNARGMRLPIDILFASLAIAQKDRAIGVVLSGMGADGTVGLQAIKAEGGLTLVQSPETATFDSMPVNAIAAKCVDIVADSAKLSADIMHHIKHLTVRDSAPIDAPVESSSLSHDGLQNITKLLHIKTGHDFSLYKTNTLHRRIERRMSIHKVDTLSDYLHFLRHNEQEIELLFKELLIGVTSFFRDPGVWQYLRDKALPTLLARQTEAKTLRAWCVGCSTGEEAFTLAMVLTETLRHVAEPSTVDIKIFASDLNPDAIATARRGKYPLSIAENVPAKYLTQYFNQYENYYQIKQSIRDLVLFAQQDVIIDPPFTKLDLIVCRNLMIYFNTKLQRKLLPLFHYSLRSEGLMLLGSSESIGSYNHLFSAIAAKYKLYERLNYAPIRSSKFMLSAFPPLTHLAKETPVPSNHTAKLPNNNLQSAADHVLLQVYAPAAVVLSEQGDIVYISGRIGKYLEPAAGKANWNFHAMVREGLRAPLFLGLKQAATQSEPIHIPNLKVQFEALEYLLDVTIQTFQEPAALKDLTMIVFHDIATSNKNKSKRNKKSELDFTHDAQLQQYRVQIEALDEEAKASKEELQASNEELQSTNEELQSTNEELTTSKEEMQSMNEELQTMNNELQTKFDDLALAQSDMKNVLNSVEIAILFLDQKLNVRRFTDRASKIINLREIDVGRPLSDLSTCLIYPELNDDVHETLRTLAFSEKEIPTDDNRWYTIRIMPYRRLDNMIDGVVITMVDITQTKNLEANLRKKQ